MRAPPRVVREWAAREGLWLTERERRRRRVRLAARGAQLPLFEDGELPRGPATREPKQSEAF
jgi:hypothetical protein